MRPYFFIFQTLTDIHHLEVVMALGKSARIWILILALPILLVLVSVLALKLYFTSDRLKAIVIPKIEEATGREVAVGDLSLTLFPSIGVEVEQLRISNPPDRGFQRPDLLSLDELALDIKLFPLFKSQLEVDNIILRHPILYLEVTKESVTNYSAPGEPPSTMAPTPQDQRETEAKKPAPFTLMLSNFEISDGEVEYVDYASDRRLKVSGYEQRTRASLSEDQTISFESQSNVAGISYGSTKSFFIENLPITSFQRATYSQDAGLLTIDSVSISIREISLLLTGSIRTTDSSSVLDLSMRSTKADLAQLLSMVPKDYLKAAAGLSSTGKFQFALTINGESSNSLQPGVRGTFEISDGSIHYSGLPKSITEIYLAGAFEQPASSIQKKSIGRFEIEKFSAALGSSLMMGKLSMVDFESPTIAATLNGNINLGEVKEYYPLEEGTQLTGSMQANLNLAGKAKEPTSIKASGMMDFRNVTVKAPASKRPLENLTGTISFNNQLIESKQLSMNLGQSDLSLAFTMRNYLAMVMKDAAASGKPSMMATLTSRQLRTADLSDDETVDSQPPTSDGKSVRSSAKESSEKGDSKGGLLPDIDVDANVSVGRLVTEKFEFTNARGSIKFREGIITLQNFSVNVFQGSVLTRGTLDTRRPDRRPFNLDLEIVGVEANSMLPKFTSFGNNLFGKFSMNTSISGEMNDTLGLNTNTLGGSGSLQIFDGKLVGYPLTTKLADYTGIGELREVIFKNWSNSFSISDGRIHIKDTKIAAANADFVMNGSQGFDGSLDYRLLVKLPEGVSNRLRVGGLAGELVQFLKDKDGRLNLNFNVTGTATNPSFALDMQEAQDAVKRALEQKLQEETKRLEGEAKKKLEEELKKKAEEGLKKLFRKP